MFWRQPYLLTHTAPSVAAAASAVTDDIHRNLQRLQEKVEHFWADCETLTASSNVVRWSHRARWSQSEQQGGASRRRLERTIQAYRSWRTQASTCFNHTSVAFIYLLHKMSTLDLPSAQTEQTNHKTKINVQKWDACDKGYRNGKNDHRYILVYECGPYGRRRTIPSAIKCRIT